MTFMLMVKTKVSMIVSIIIAVVMAKMAISKNEI